MIGKYKSSIKTKLIGIIFLVATLTSFIGYVGFIYWYMDNQYKKANEQSHTIGLVISQDVAKLILLDEISIASDITSKLKSFNNIDKLVLYSLDRKAIFQYSKNDNSFIVPKFEEGSNKNLITKDILTLRINVVYQDKHLGYLRLDLKVESVFDVILNNIKMPLFIILCMVLVSYLLALYFAKKFTEPILNLVAFLEKIDTFSFLDNYPKVNEENEVGKIYQVVKTMLGRIKESQKALKIASVAFETQSGMMITDTNKKILSVNKAFTNILGYTQDEVVGSSPSVLKSNLTTEDFYKNINHSLQTNHYWSGEINNLHKNGNIIKEYLTIQVVLDDDGEIIYYVASFLDLTLQKNAEAKLLENEQILRQQSKMAIMGEMLENIAHQWRQPLSIISTISTGMLLNKELGIPLTQEEETVRLNKINDSSHFLSQTIDDFREFFKPDKQKMFFNPKESYLKTIKLINSTFKHHSIEVIENLEDFEILGFNNELMQTIMNVLNNARDILETRDKGEKRYIFVDIYRENYEVVIRIKDNAGGIPLEILDKIFLPYFTTKELSNGTGIGLYMSYEMIVNHMNGKFFVSNEAFVYEQIAYVGACFTIKLPMK